MVETWKVITGYENYEVSDLGRVRSVKRGIILRPFTKKGTEYKRATLWNRSKQHKFYVHRLVANAFPEICGEYFEGATVDHLNGIKDDNRAVNLRYKTIRDNIMNPVTHPKSAAASRKNIAKTRNPEIIAKIRATKSKAVKCLETGKEYWSRLAASEDTGVHPDSIWQCCHGIRRTAGGLHWVWV